MSGTSGWTKRGLIAPNDPISKFLTRDYWSASVSDDYRAKAETYARAPDRKDEDPPHGSVRWAAKLLDGSGDVSEPSSVPAQKDYRIGGLPTNTCDEHYQIYKIARADVRTGAEAISRVRAELKTSLPDWAEKLDRFNEFQASTFPSPISIPTSRILKRIIESADYALYVYSISKNDAQTFQVTGRDVLDATSRVAKGTSQHFSLEANIARNLRTMSQEYGFMQNSGCDVSGLSPTQLNNTQSNEIISNLNFFHWLTEQGLSPLFTRFNHWHPIVA